MNQNESKEVFRKSFRGYNPEEVDECIEGLKRDIESLKSEVSGLYSKLEKSNSEIEKYKRMDAVRNDMIEDAKKEADGILKDAKGRAAHIIIRTSRQCNRIVADMVSQVEEQKKLYDAAKSEVRKFRNDLFTMYGDHVRKINAYSEAAGVFDVDGLEEGELDSFLKLLNYDGTDEEDGYGFRGVTSVIEKEVKEVRKAEKELRSDEPDGKPADQTAGASDDPGESSEAAEEAKIEAAELVTEDEEAEDSEEAEEAETAEEVDEMSASEDEPTGEDDAAEEDKKEIGSMDGAAAEEPAVSDGDFVFDKEFSHSEDAEKKETEASPFAIDSEDIGEFGLEGPKADKVDEYDGPVSLNDVFRELKSYDEADFEAVYGEPDDEAESKKAEPTPEELEERRRRAEDDSNEFYTFDDDEYEPDADPEEPTTEIGSIGEDLTESLPSKRRWKIKRSMSITDEFKAIKAEEEDDE
ncbi:MAG: DivIVA domain-containing protein [Clostridia bacterium]|nr:DivIVA domain-containing protein [Clostridia bacterium]